MFLYLTKDALYLKKSGWRLIIDDIKDQSTQEIPLSLIEGIVIFGRVQLSTDVIRAMLKARTPVFFLSKKWSYFGKLDSLEVRNVELLYHQSRASLDDDLSLWYAKTFIISKIHNARTMLLRWGRFYNIYALQHHIDQLKMMIPTIQDVSSKESLRGKEWYCAKIFFDGFALAIKKPFDFKTRNRRPPLDPVNAMLSLWYTLLAQTVTMALDIQNINTQIWFFHEPKDLKPILVLDVMEQYRSWIVDDMVVRMTQTQKLTLEHFAIDEQDDKRPCRMTDDGLKIFLNEYYRLMFKEKDNWNMDTEFIKLKIIEKNIEQLKQSLVTWSYQYEGFTLK